MSLRSLCKLSSPLVCGMVTLALAGCGSSHKPLTHEDNTGAGGVNSSYITLGKLHYQVQISRELNPYDTEDKSYLVGVPPSQIQPPPGYLWLGVFLLVLNTTSSPHLSASTFSLSDTQNHVYTPVALPTTNLFAYQPELLQPGAQIPDASSPAAAVYSQASLLLFKLPAGAYDNRPLILSISDPADPAKKGTVTLDV